MEATLKGFLIYLAKIGFIIVCGVAAVVAVSIFVG